MRKQIILLVLGMGFFTSGAMADRKDDCLKCLTSDCCYTSEELRKLTSKDQLSNAAESLKKVREKARENCGSICKGVWEYQILFDPKL